MLADVVETKTPTSMEPCNTLWMVLLSDRSRNSQTSKRLIACCIVESIQIVHRLILIMVLGGGIMWSFAADLLEYFNYVTVINAYLLQLPSQFSSAKPKSHLHYRRPTKKCSLKVFRISFLDNHCSFDL